MVWKYSLIFGLLKNVHIEFWTPTPNILATENRFFKLIGIVAEKGISSQIYKQRAEILYPLFKASNENTENQCVLIDCAALIDKLCAQLMRETYSLR